MANSAVLNEAARVLQLVHSGTPADAALRETLGRTRFGSAPARRREVSHAVFSYFRWLRWLDSRESLQKQVAAALDWQARFDREPTSIKAEALAARAVPEWTLNEISWPQTVGVVAPNDASAEKPLERKRSHPTATAWLRQIQRDPTLWIRIKRGHEAAVTSALGDCTPAEHSALRSPLAAFCFGGSRDLFLTDEFKTGRVEIQDLASQLVGHACAPRPGQTWWDACAGEGGKTMHLSDLMQNKGMIWASDRSKRRLEHLKKRAARAEAFNYRAEFWDGSAKLPTKTKFDGVLVDAPCSGVGTWQRNPHARWTTSVNDVRELAAIQQQLLANVAPALKSGGRLVFAVCTLTRAETTAIAEHFNSTQAEFEPAPVFPDAPPSALSTQLFLWPHEINANGMFIAAWKRK